MAGITIKRELRLSFAPSNTAIFSGFRQPFSNTNEARVPPAHWIMHRIERGGNLPGSVGVEI